MGFLPTESISSQPRYDHFDTAADMSTRMCDVRLIRIPDFQPKIKRQPDISSGRRYFSLHLVAEQQGLLDIPQLLRQVH